MSRNPVKSVALQCLWSLLTVAFFLLCETALNSEEPWEFDYTYPKCVDCVNDIWITCTVERNVCTDETRDSCDSGSVINLVSLEHLHDAQDYVPAPLNVGAKPGGCSPCQGGSAALLPDGFTAAPQFGLTRVHRYRSWYQRSSLGQGAMSLG